MGNRGIDEKRQMEENRRAKKKGTVDKGNEKGGRMNLLCLGGRPWGMCIGAC